jgi:GDP-4-dehydro-6-deoxy-D-mannose reductase
MQSIDNRILITGASGFVGSYLIPALRKSFVDSKLYPCCIGKILPKDAVNVEWLNLDLRDYDQFDNLIRKIKPTHILHLASVSHVPTSINDPHKTFEVNLMATLHMFDSILKITPKTKIIYISSSEVYGKSFKNGLALTEDAVLQPENPYAVSKMATDLMAQQFAKQGLLVIILRPFNHIGPGQSEDFVASSFAAQIARIESGICPPVIHVGNLDSVRDFLPVDNVVNAYIAVLKDIDKISSGTIYNICSSKPIKIRDMLDQLISLSSQSIEIKKEPGLVRRSDIPIAIGDSNLIQRELGWLPETVTLDTLKSILQYWRSAC